MNIIKVTDGPLKIPRRNRLSMEEKSKWVF